MIGNFIMNINSGSYLKRSQVGLKGKTRENLHNILTINSRSCSGTRNSHFLKQKYSVKEEEIPKVNQNSLSPEKIKSLMQDLIKAEQYLKETKTYSKFKVIKEKIEPIEEPAGISFSQSLSLRKFTTKRVRTPAKIPRSGINIQCLYKYGL